MAVAIERYRFTVDQYHQMAEVGIFSPECRVELIDGEIFEMAPVGLDPRSEPQPDVMLLIARADFYGTAHPGPEHALLLVEVADTSLAHDRGRKLPLYARAGVAEIWIVNRDADAVEVYRSPSREGYREQDRRRRGEEVAPAAFPDIRLSVGDILG